MVSSADPAAKNIAEVRIKSAVTRSCVSSKRATTEDGLLLLPAVPLFAVADGTGGPEAARAALRELEKEASSLVEKNERVGNDASTTSRLALGRYLEGLFAKANHAVFEAAKKIPGRRIATTLCAVTMVGPHAFVAHVGDSRAYLLRDGRLRRLTEDHTVGARQLDRGVIDGDVLSASPLRFALAQALGMSRALEVDVLELHLLPGDLLLLTTDGLTRALSEEEIGTCLEIANNDGRADLLIEKVIEAGAPDDTSFVLIATESAQRPRPAPRGPLGTTGEQRRPSPVVDLEAIARSSFLFAGLSDTEWHQMQPYLEVIDAGSDSVMCQSDEIAPGFGVVVQGALKAAHPSGEERHIGPGGHFGALALVSGGKSPATISATSSCRIYLLTRRHFLEFVRLKPSLGSRLTLSLLDTLGNHLATLTTRLGQLVAAANGK